MKMTIALALVASAAGFAAEGYHVINTIKIGGTGGWDYVTADPANHRVFVSHGTSVAVVDTRTSAVAATISGLQGVHGIALAPEFNKGFISDGRANKVVVFDLRTLQKTGEIPAGTNPDSICFEPKTKRIFAFNGRSNDATVIDASDNAVVATIPVGPKPEFSVVDGSGKVYVNIEDSAEVIEIDASKPAVTRRASLAPCEEPSGLAIDTRDKTLFSVCANKMMAVTDIPTLKVVATPEIGGGTDGAGFDSGAAFSSNGGSGTLTVVKNVNGKWQPVETLKTERGARTMTVDHQNHKLYLPTAEFGQVPATERGQRRRPPIVPDTFHLIVVGK